jgi:prepilin-type N-terminal cleavage/methylation domain-containing protein
VAGLWPDVKRLLGAANSANRHGPDRRALRRNGFTVVELMVAVSMIAILATFAAPMFRSYLQQAEIQASGREVQVILANARSEAIKRNCNVVVTRVTAGFQFATVGCVVDGPLVVTGMTSGGVFKTSSGVAITGAPSVQFSRIGSASSQTTFTLTSAKYNTTMTVTVSPTGRVTIGQ